MNMKEEVDLARSGSPASRIAAGQATDFKISLSIAPQLQTALYSKPAPERHLPPVSAPGVPRSDTSPQVSASGLPPVTFRNTGLPKTSITTCLFWHEICI